LGGREPAKACVEGRLRWHRGAFEGKKNSPYSVAANLLRPSQNSNKEKKNRRASRSIRSWPLMLGVLTTGNLLWNEEEGGSHQGWNLKETNRKLRTEDTTILGPLWHAPRCLLPKNGGGYPCEREERKASPRGHKKVARKPKKSYQREEGRK